MLELFVEFADADVAALDLFGDFLHAREDGGRVLLVALQRGDFFVGLIALRLQGFIGFDQLAAFRIDFAERLHVERDAAVARHFLDYVEVVPYVSQVEHRFSSITDFFRM